jgi:cyclopropane fatty-acyl-phospholipid synthase-like methyltransferase
MGQRITEDQVTLLVDHILAHLALDPADVLIDLGCGNGALSARLFGSCAGFTGVDASAYLIDVAKEFFERPPTHTFVHADVLTFVATDDRPERFTRCLCYAVLQYLTPAAVAAVLQTLYDRFPNLRHVMIGNLPDREKAAVFFTDGYRDEDLLEPQSQIGRWWYREEFVLLASRIGWAVTAFEMPPNLFNASYRFDAVLTKG